MKTKKKTGQMKLFKFFATLNLLLSPIAISAHAQADRGGNGGDPSELAEFTGRNGEHLDSWYSVRQDLIKGLENGQHLNLNLNGLSADEFKIKSLNVLKTVKVEFNNQKIAINGVTRVCRNFEENLVKKIQCNTANYSQAMQNYTAEEQYKLIAHEYFGVAGLEPNTDGLSDYPISSQISKSLQDITVKRWSVTAEENCPEVTGQYSCGDIGKVSLEKTSDGYLLVESGYLTGEKKFLFPLNRWDSKTSAKSSCEYGSLFLVIREHIRGENTGYYQNVFAINSELGGISIELRNDALSGAFGAWSCVKLKD